MVLTCCYRVIQAILEYWPLNERNLVAWAGVTLCQEGLKCFGQSKTRHILGTNV